MPARAVVEKATATRVSVPCGVVRSTGRFEWRCVAPVHDSERQRSARPDHRGYPARSERHLFVRRWSGDR